jgi:hypothetical protein
MTSPNDEILTIRILFGATTVKIFPYFLNNANYITLTPSNCLKYSTVNNSDYD